MPRLIRRKPLLERIKDYLHPGDFLLWLSEEIETRDWDSKAFAGPFALGLHVVFLISRANSGVSSGWGGDDVFGEDSSGSGWLAYILSFFVYVLTAFSLLNAAYTFNRTKNYRLFESAIETPQDTPSAHRVRVDSSPASSSPLRFLTSILGDTTPESRAHPDPTRDVWEISVWDPIPVCLRLSCLFSPGHVLVYWLFLPTHVSDPRPSMTVFTAIVLQFLLSSQLLLLQNSFSQQEKDSAIIQREVLSEYDIKFVHPRLNPMMRDVGTQYDGPLESGEEDYGDVDTYTPAVTIKRGFRPNPNPNYAKHIDPDNTENFSRQSLTPTRPTYASPTAPSPYTPSAYGSQEPGVFSNMTPRQPPLRQPQFRPNMSSNMSRGDGGSLGAFSHAQSPLRKSTSMHIMGSTPAETPRNSIEMAAREQGEHKMIRPKKRLSDAHRAFLGLEPKMGTPHASSIDNALSGQGGSSPYKRFPSRF
ncbi:hypothetical protein HYALB_00001239 [Hymenoscyphus albidus]|uniref:Meiotically up-regulated gene 154 protein n=1 Tax=Hymenoscyphus albidus TaxID=595503 RepID=A0A9N9LH89_9HELO|nr:hypothetical protein HYALB_00001239 [Hymenoscyphus albidus]